MITIATLVPERKPYILDSPTLPRLVEICKATGANLYINFEYLTPHSLDSGDLKRQLDEKIGNYPYVSDSWVLSSTWRRRPKFDQDQARVAYITMARNMALEYALACDSSHILYIDADVVPPLDILQKLLEAKVKIVGGVVGGRGAHSHVNYIFGEEVNYVDKGIVYKKVFHGTAGCMLIHKDVFKVVKWGYGKRDGNGFQISEDPWFCDVARKFLNEKMLIRMDAICEHWDAPGHELTITEAENDYHA
jgi:hypothetical protein